MVFNRQNSHFCKFGQSFRNWIKILYNNIQSAVVNNGYISESFQLQRGVRKGCPLSCYLFIFVVRVLSLKICNIVTNTSSIVDDREIKISQLAVETSLFSTNTNSIEPIVETLQQFHHLSVSKANTEKTTFYNIGITDFANI